MEKNYFEEIKNESSKNKIYLGIIGALLIIDIVAVKSLVSVASNKEVKISVPQYVEPGQYAISANMANEKVHKMWSKIWTEELANFSYKDVRKKILFVADYLAPETAFKNKAELINFIEYIETNFITQSLDLNPASFTFKKLDDKNVQVSWSGTLKRKIGMEDDALSNIVYKYTFVSYVKNGQIFIKNLNMDLDKPREAAHILKENKFVDYGILPNKTKDQKRKEAKAEKEQEKLIKGTNNE